MLGHQLASMVLLQWILDHRLLFQVNDPRHWATTLQSPFTCLILQGFTMTFKPHSSISPHITNPLYVPLYYYTTIATTLTHTHTHTHIHSQQRTLYIHLKQDHALCKLFPLSKYLFSFHCFLIVVKDLYSPSNCFQ